MNVKTIDLAAEGMLLPTAPDVCQECAVKHDPRLPHNQQSLFWLYWFYQKEGRWPTWADAMAHCTDEVKQATKDVLAKYGIKV